MAAHEELIGFESYLGDESDIDFRKTFLYKYLCNVFQYVDNSQERKSSSQKKFQKICRFLSLVLMWLCLAIKMSGFAINYNDQTKRLDTFNAIYLVVQSITWMLRFVLLHNLGLYLLARYPNEAILLTNKLDAKAKTWDEKLRLKNQVKKQQKIIVCIIFVTLGCVTIVPIITSIISLAIEGDWTSGEIIIDMMMTLYTRIVSLPCLFYIVYVALLQRVQIEEYFEKLVHSEKSSDALFKAYIKMHRRIEKVARQTHVYLSVLLILLMIWCSLTAYQTIGSLKKLSTIKCYNKTLVLYETLANFLVFGLEIFLLFTIPWYFLGKVTETQQNLVSRIMEIEYSKNSDNKSPFKSFDDVWQFSKRIEKHQKYEDIGYRAIRLKITTLKIVWITIFAPILLHLGSAVMKGSIE